MGLIEWAKSPYGEDIPIHVAWFLIWVSAIGGLAFLIVHAIYVKFFAKAEVFADTAPPDLVARVPAKVARHSLAARLFHWIMAAAMFTLLITAFLPKIGVEFAWVTWHWIAGIVLTISVIYHIIHATFWQDPWAIWPDKADLEDAQKRWKQARGEATDPPRKFAKYPLENKMYHGIIVLAGLSVILTGVFMIFRVRTGIFPRNPYLFGDMTWGLMYVLHGLAGVGLIALVIAHVYFALRPDKFDITKSMVFGSMSREHYLENHDPVRWPPDAESSKSTKAVA